MALAPSTRLSQPPSPISHNVLNDGGVQGPELSLILPTPLPCSCPPGQRIWLRDDSTTSGPCGRIQSDSNLAEGQTLPQICCRGSRLLALHDKGRGPDG